MTPEKHGHVRERRPGARGIGGDRIQLVIWWVPACESCRCPNALMSPVDPRPHDTVTRRSRVNLRLWLPPLSPAEVIRMPAWPFATVSEWSFRFVLRFALTRHWQRAFEAPPPVRHARRESPALPHNLRPATDRAAARFRRLQPQSSCQDCSQVG
jgi:hypothetical protein